MCKKDRQVFTTRYFQDVKNRVLIITLSGSTTEIQLTHYSYCTRIDGTDVRMHSTLKAKSIMTRL